MPLEIETLTRPAGSYFHIRGDSFDEVQVAIANIQDAPDTHSATFSLPRRRGDKFEAHGLVTSIHTVAHA